MASLKRQCRGETWATRMQTTLAVWGSKPADRSRQPNFYDIITMSTEITTAATRLRSLSVAQTFIYSPFIIQQAFTGRLLYARPCQETECLGRLLGNQRSHGTGSHLSSNRTAGRGFPAPPSSCRHRKVSWWYSPEHVPSGDPRRRGGEGRSPPEIRSLLSRRSHCSLQIPRAPGAKVPSARSQVGFRSPLCCSPS